MKFCSECGANVEGKKFCSECGAPVAHNSKIETGQAAAPAPLPNSSIAAKQPFWHKTWVVVLSCIFLPPLGIFILWASNAGKENTRILLSVILGAISILWLNVMLGNVMFPDRLSNSSNAPNSQTTQQTTVKEISEPDFKAACVAQPYSDLARTPDSYKNMKLVITGKIVQVMEKSNGAQYRIAVDDNYDQMFYVDYTGDFAAGRMLENDIVTLWGTYDGLMSYTATIGGKITVPSLIAKYYQIN